MTEEEAKTKRCVHRGLDRGSINHCVGSECMAWRDIKAIEGGLYMDLTAYQWTFVDQWCVGKTIQANGDNLYDIRFEKLRRFTESGEDLPDQKPKAYGYCGLAGKP